MADKKPQPNNPLAPYYPSETPSLSGNGRKWFTILVLGFWLFLAAVALAVELFL